MPSKKNTTQKQKQKKAKQQQQQQQNIKISVRVGEKSKPRKSGKVAVRQPIARQIQTPIIQQAPYIPMFLNQQPAQYFTPPVASSTLPITPPATPSAPIPTVAPSPTIIPLPRTSVPSPRTNIPIPISPPTRPTVPTITRATPAPSIELDTFTNFGPSQNAISNLVGFTDLDEPTPFSFGNRSTFYSAIDEFNDYTDFGTQTDIIPPPPPTFIRKAGTQTDLTYVRRTGTQTTPTSQSDIETQFEPAFTIAYQNELATQTEPTFQREFETQTMPTVAFDAETQTGRRYVSSTETQTPSTSQAEFATQTIPIPPPLPISQRNFGTQFEEFMPQVPDVIPTAVSSTLREMETQTDKIIPRPPPLPSFTAPTQDIQPSGIQSIVNLTQENLRKVGGLSSVMPRGISEISDLTEGTSRSINTDISNFIQEEAMRRAGSRAPIEEILKQQKEEKKKEAEDRGMFGQMKKEMEKRRQFIQPPEEKEPPAVEPSEWDDEPKQPARQKVGEKKMEVSSLDTSGQTEEDTKTIINKFETDLEEKIQNIEFWKNQIENMKKRGIKRDMTGLTVEDYEREIEDAEEAIKFYESEIESLQKRISTESTEEVPSITELILREIENEINELTDKLSGLELMKKNYNRKKIKLLESGGEIDEDGYSVSRYDKLIENNKKEIKSTKQLKTRRQNQLKKMIEQGSKKGLAPIQEDEEEFNVEFEE